MEIKINPVEDESRRLQQIEKLESMERDYSETIEQLRIERIAVDNRRSFLDGEITLLRGNLEVTATYRRFLEGMRAVSAVSVKEWNKQHKED